MKILFIRHGEPNYENVTRLGLVSYLGELTKEGVMQAEKVSHDDRLKGAELIVSSPFTRALQTEAIISKNTGIPLTVEPAFHEWLADCAHTQTLDNEYSKLAYKEFCENNFELAPSSNSKKDENLRFSFFRPSRVFDRKEENLSHKLMFFCVIGKKINT